MHDQVTKPSKDLIEETASRYTCAGKTMKICCTTESKILQNIEKHYEILS